MIKSIKDIKCERLGNPYSNPIFQRLYEIDMAVQWDDSLSMDEKAQLLEEKNQIKILKAKC